MTTTYAPRPLIENVPDGYVQLPAHAFDDEGECVHCGESPLWESYEAYTAHFYAHEYEGEPGHAPQDEEAWTYLSDSCLA